MTHLSNDDIAAQLKAEFTTLKIAGVERIVSKNNTPTTVGEVITGRESEITVIINWNNRQQ